MAVTVDAVTAATVDEPRRPGHEGTRQPRDRWRVADGAAARGGRAGPGARPVRGLDLVGPLVVRGAVRAGGGAVPERAPDGPTGASAGGSRGRHEPADPAARGGG